MQRCRWGLGLLGAGLLACGSMVNGEVDASVEASAKDSGSDSPAFGDAGTVDATFDAPPVALDGGGDFLCNDCVCNGVGHYCGHFSGGKAHPSMPIDGGFGDASACDPDAGQTYCTAIPSQCLPNPSCACVLAPMPPTCTCDLDPSGNGLVVSCVFP
jgi:hypothetical protein